MILYKANTITRRYFLANEKIAEGFCQSKYSNQDYLKHNDLTLLVSIYIAEELDSSYDYDHLKQVVDEIKSSRIYQAACRAVDGL